MKYIFNYKKFLLEGNFLGNSTITGDDDNDLYNYMNDLKNKTFDKDVNFIKEVDIDYSDIIIKLKYYHTKRHNLIDRIKCRTNINSISEFNEILENVIKQLFPNKLNNFTKTGKYDIYLEDLKFHIIIDIDYENFFDDYNIEIATILNNGSVTDCIKTIKIDE